jgi:16S rRNA (cytosine1407-C5)-methyltransferase
MGKRKTGKAEQTPVSGPETFQHLLDAEEYQKLVNSIEQPLSPSIRVNPLKVDVRQSLEKWAECYGWKTRPVPYCSTGWWIDESNTPVSQTWEHRLGYYYIQDAASMLPVELFDFPLPPEAQVLDMAASPGGKTTHLASRLNDHALIIANDSSTSRLTALRLILQNWGAVNVGITHYPGEQLGGLCPASFDAVLLDAPCSMQGLRSTESHPIRTITPREQSDLAMRQQRLLESAVMATREGGQIVYSTCTLAPMEDEGVVDAVLKRFGSSLRLEDVSYRLPVVIQGIARDGNSIYSNEVRKTARIWPHVFGTAGFFAARFTRMQTNGSGPEKFFGNKKGLPGAILIDRQIQAICDQWMNDFGFNLGKVLEEYHLGLVQQGREIIAVPYSVLQDALPLTFLSCGLPMAEINPDGYHPVHEWLTRFESQFHITRYNIPNDQVTSWLQGSDLPGKPTGSFANRQLVLTMDERGRYLGLAKILNDRLKNLLPRRVVAGW